MSVVIVTNSDVAAIPFDGNKGYSFCLDEQNKGPFAVMLALSQLRDPAQKEACIDIIAAQLLAIKDPSDRDKLLPTHAGYFLRHAIGSAKRNNEGNDVINALFGGFGYPSSHIQSLIDLAWDDYDDLRKLTDHFLQKKLPLAADHQRERLCEQLIYYADRYGISCKYDASHYTPHSRAEMLYEQLLESAKESGATVINSPTAEQIANVRRGLDACPPHVAAYAESNCLPIAIIDDNVALGAILTNTPALDGGGGYLGMSTGSNIYIQASCIAKTDYLREELLHEAERCVLEGNPIPHFSLQESWKAALLQDLNTQSPLQKQITQIWAGKRNKAEEAEQPGRSFFETTLHAGSLLRHILLTHQNAFLASQMGWPKYNTALKPDYSFPPMAVDKQPSAWMETLPDMYHMAALVDSTLQNPQNPFIQLMVKGLQARDINRNRIMARAFPNAWPMLEGPDEGKILGQYANGKVASFEAGSELPIGVGRVYSLKEHCEASMAEEARCRQQRDLTLPGYLTSTPLKNFGERVKQIPSAGRSL